MTTAGRPIEAIATGQHGNFTRQQAHAAGLTRGVLRSRDQSGNLVKVGVRTYASPLMPRSALTDLSALMLDIGDPVWACGPTSAALTGFDGFVLAPPFHLVILRDRNVRRLGHVLHTTADLTLIDQVTVNGFRATSATRTIIDLARSMPPATVTAAIDSALRDGLTSENFLHRRISELRSSGRYGIPALLAIIEGAEITRGGHSWLERRFLELVAAAGLPRPTTQAVLARAGDKLVRVDALFESQRVVVEVLGYRWHRSKAHLQRDTERINRLTLDGYFVLQFTYSDVAEHPERVIAPLTEALTGRRFPGFA